MDAPAADGGVGGMGGFLLTVGTAFGYAAGWTPYAADSPATSRRRCRPCGPAFSLRRACSRPASSLEVVGAASVTPGGDSLAIRRVRSPPARFAPCEGDAIGHRDRRGRRQRDQHLFRRNGFRHARDQVAAHVARALVTVFFGVAGFLVAWWALPDAAHSYEAFLLIIAYWVGPWLGVVFADQYLRRGQTRRRLPLRPRVRQLEWLAAFVIGLVASVLLFSNQQLFVGVVAEALPGLGDITFFVGFVLAGAAYLVLCRSKIEAERAAV